MVGGVQERAASEQEKKPERSPKRENLNYGKSIGKENITRPDPVPGEQGLVAPVASAAAAAARRKQLCKTFSGARREGCSLPLLFFPARFFFAPFFLP